MTPVESWLLILAIIGLVIFVIAAARQVAAALQNEADTIEYDD